MNLALLFLQASASAVITSSLAWAVLQLARWLTGAAWHARRWMRGQHHVRMLRCADERLDDASLAAHPAFERHSPALPPVLELDASLSPPAPAC